MRSEFLESGGARDAAGKLGGKARNTRDKTRQMKFPRLFSQFSFVFACFAISFVCAAQARAQIRLATLDLGGDEKGEVASLLRSLAEADSYELLDSDLARAASRGAGYDGGLNLSRSQSQSLGRSLGCDFFIVGKVQNTRRTGLGDEFYFESSVGLFLVETNSGRLVKFYLERAKDQSEPQAQARLRELIAGNWKKYSAEIVSARERRKTEIANIRQSVEPIPELLSDDTASEGTQLPVFYQRMKPAYTEDADLGGVTATVELEVTFGQDGRVGDIEVVRWAGYGLDESAIAAVRQIKFKPAQREGKSLTIRGLVRYNFRRPHTQAAKPAAQSHEEIEKLKRSMRRIQLPEPMSGQMPNRDPGRKPKQNPEF